MLELSLIASHVEIVNLQRFTCLQTVISGVELEDVCTSVVYQVITNTLMPPLIARYDNHFRKYFAIHTGEKRILEIGQNLT